MRGGITGGPGTSDPSRWSSINTTLAALVRQAYGLKAYEYVGPAWTEELRFDVEARVPLGTQKSEFDRMLQNLLAERFHLSFHRARKEIFAWQLVVMKGGPKLTRASDGSPSKEAAPGRTAMNSLTVDRDGYPILHSGQSVVMIRGKARCHLPRCNMQQFASMLSSQVDQPVFDATGLSGEYDIDLWWGDEARSAAAAAESDPVLTIYKALENQLGLKLENRKRPVEVLIVDRALRAPTDN